MTAASRAVASKESSNADADATVHAALHHFAASNSCSMDVNRDGLHAVALGLLRHAVEALSVVDVGLQPLEYRDALIADWKEGRVSLGQLRQRMEAGVWVRYGNGLWDEPWAHYFGNLARAVQPYAHYSSQLMAWQFLTLDHTARPGSSGPIQTIEMLGAYDPLKASRITLFHSLLLWTLARLVLANANECAGINPAAIEELGMLLGSSKLLFQRADWGKQLLASMLFYPGKDWRDL
jgi:hypothetical protein